MPKQSGSKPTIVGILPAADGNVVKSIFPDLVFRNDSQIFNAILQVFQGDIDDYTPTFVYKGAAHDEGEKTFTGKIVGKSEIVRVDVSADVPADAAMVGMWKLTFVLGSRTIDAVDTAEFKIEEA